MSETNNSMSLRDLMATRTDHIRVQLTGDFSSVVVNVRRLKTHEMLEISKHRDDSKAALAMVACALQDEDGSVMFTFDEVQALDWALTQELIAAVYKVNGIRGKIEAAAKN